MNWGSTSKWQVSNFLWQKLISKHWKALKDYSHPSRYRECNSHVFSMLSVWMCGFRINLFEGFTFPFIIKPHVVTHVRFLSPSDSKHPLSRWPHHKHWLDEEKVGWTEECNLQIQWGIRRYPAVRRWQDQLWETCKRRPTILFDAWDWTVKLCLCHNLQILQNVQSRVVELLICCFFMVMCTVSVSSIAIQISKTILLLLEYIV